MEQELKENAGKLCDRVTHFWESSPRTLVDIELSTVQCSVSRRANKGNETLLKPYKAPLNSLNGDFHDYFGPLYHFMNRFKVPDKSTKYSVI